MDDMLWISEVLAALFVGALVFVFVWGMLEVALDEWDKRYEKAKPTSEVKNPPPSMGDDKGPLL